MSVTLILILSPTSFVTNVCPRGRGTGADAGRWRTRDGSFSSDTSASDSVLALLSPGAQRFTVKILVFRINKLKDNVYFVFGCVHSWCSNAQFVRISRKNSRHVQFSKFLWFFDWRRYWRIYSWMCRNIQLFWCIHGLSQVRFYQGFLLFIIAPLSSLFQFQIETD